MQEYRDELLADLHEFFHLDLLDFDRGRLPLYTIYACVKSLMKKSGRSTLAMALDEHLEWTPEMYVMARISDAMEVSNYLFIQANSGEDSEPIPAPKPIPRPGEEEEEPEKPKQEEFASGHEVAAFFNKMSSL